MDSAFRLSWFYAPNKVEYRFNFAQRAHQDKMPEQWHEIPDYVKDDIIPGDNIGLRSLVRRHIAERKRKVRTIIGVTIVALTGLSTIQATGVAEKIGAEQINYGIMAAVAATSLIGRAAVQSREDEKIAEDYQAKRGLHYTPRVDTSHFTFRQRIDQQ